MHTYCIIHSWQCLSYVKQIGKPSAVALFVTQITGMIIIISILIYIFTVQHIIIRCLYSVYLFVCLLIYMYIFIYFVLGRLADWLTDLLTYFILICVSALKYSALRSQGSSHYCNLYESVHDKTKCNAYCKGWNVYLWHDW